MNNDKLKFVVDSRSFDGSCVTTMSDGIHGDYHHETLEELRDREKNPYLTAVSGNTVRKMIRIHLQSLCAKGQRYPLKASADREEPALANIIVTCTDNIRSRMNLWRFLKKHREHTSNNERSPIYWMDFGNARTTGQVLIGNIRGKILQPVSNEYLPVPRMNVITEEVRYSTIKEKDSGPSCSLAEALQKQDLFINSILAQTGCDILWRMLREGRTFYRGAYLNLDTLRINPIPV